MCYAAIAAPPTYLPSSNMVLEGPLTMAVGQPGWPAPVELAKKPEAQAFVVKCLVLFGDVSHIKLIGGHTVTVTFHPRGS